jgi:hypothetical protein
MVTEGERERKQIINGNITETVSKFKCLTRSKSESKIIIDITYEGALNQMSAFGETLVKTMRKEAQHI